MGAVKNHIMDKLEDVERFATVLLDSQPPEVALWEQAYDTFIHVADAVDDNGEWGLVSWAKEYAAVDFADDYTFRSR